MSRKGFTIIEVLTVALIIGLLAVFVVPRMFRGLGKAKRDIARSKMAIIESGLVKFQYHCGRVPDDSEGLEALLEAPLVHPDTGRDLGLPLLGIVDLLLDHQEGPLIADIKTTSRRSTPVDVVHEIQLTCYAYLVRQTCDVQESGLEIRALVKTKVPQVQFHRQAPRTQVHFRRLFAVIEAYLDDLRSERFVFRPGWTCSMCEFRDTHGRRWSGETDVPGPRRHALRRSGSRSSGSRLDLSDLINKDDGS